MPTYPTHKWSRNFYRLFVGQGLASLLTTTVNYVLVFYLTAMTKSASILTTAQIASLVPMAVLSPLAGSLVDRFSKKKLLMISDALVGAITLMIVIYSWHTGGQLAIAAILLSNILRSVAMSVQNPATQSSVPELVPNEQLLKVNGQYSALQAINQLLPPVLAGILYGLMPIDAILFLTVLANLMGLLAVAITSFPKANLFQKTNRSLFGDIQHGYGAIRENRALFHLFVFKVISSAIIMPATVLYPLMTTQHFHGSLKVDAPIVEVGLAIGMLISGLTISHLPKFKHRLTPSLIGIATVAASLTVSSLLPGNRLGFVIFVMVNFLAGFALPLMDAPVQTLLQESIVRENLGKVISLLLMAIGLAGPLGLMIGGVWSTIVPTSGMFLTSGLLLVALSVLAGRDKLLRNIH